MYLQRLSILNYKNIVETDVTFSPKINCFIGRNGMGKTNLLDAVYYLSFCKSYLNSIDNQLINYDADFFMLQGWYERNDKEEMVCCGVKRRQKKQFKRNKQNYERLSDHIGLLPLVIISPADLQLILGGSEERRRFLDIIISQYDKEYLTQLMAYNVALRNRNALLKSEEMVADDVMEVYEIQMAQAADYIFACRIAFIEKFLPTFQRYYSQISANNESVELKYESHLQEGGLMAQLRASRQKDQIIGFTTRGVHKDDLGMFLESYPIKKAGSQGQNKTYFVAMKLAQFDLLKETSGLTPILLIDDVFDKLDAERVKRIVEIVSTEQFGQIFFTDTNREHLDEVLNEVSSEMKLFSVEKGNVIC